jgi:aspartyl-tRNA(Asn)/glutamyl-tRNA(Gln) amidotransferase subunit C
MPQQLTTDQVQKVATLSRLHITQAEVEKYAVQISAILDNVATLNELNVEGVEPMTDAMGLHTVMREDKPIAGLPVESVLANAPARADDGLPFFKVPKVIDDGGGA